MPVGTVTPENKVAVKAIGATSPVARANPKSEPEIQPLKLWGKTTDQMIRAERNPSAAAASIY